MTDFKCCYDSCLSLADIRFLGCPTSTVDDITAVTYRNDIVQVYSNSWGFVPSVATIGPLWNMALRNAMTVCIYYKTGFTHNVCM